MDIDSKESAHSYHTVSNVYIVNRLNAELLKFANFDKTDNVLDVGCGTGAVTRQIAPLVDSIIGIDIASKWIQYAADNTPPNTEYIVLNAVNFGDYLDEWRNRFDKIYCSAMFHWLPDQGSALKNIYECLKPGGQLFLGFALQSTVLSKTCRFGETLDAWVRKHPKWSTIFTDSVVVDLCPTWESEEAFLEFVKSFGFTVLKAELMDPWIKWDGEFMRAIVKIFDPFTKHVPGERKEEFLDDVCEFLHDASPKRADGMAHGEVGPYDHLLLVARK